MKKKTDILIAAAVVAAAIALLFGLYASVENNPFRKSDTTFAVDFEDATGVKERSKVLFLGVPVGQVSDINYQRATNRARIEIEINRDIDIPANVQAYVTGSLLGESHIALESETAPEGSLSELAKNGDLVMQGISRSKLESLAPGADDAISGAKGAARAFAQVQGERVNATVTAVGELFDDLSAFGKEMAAGDTGTLSTKVESVVGTLEGLIESGAGDATLAGNLTGIVRDLRDSSTGLKTMLNPTEGGPATVFDRLNSVAGELEGALATFNKLYDTLEKADQTLSSYGDASQSIKDASAEVESLATNMQGFANKISDRPSAVIFSKSDGKSGDGGTERRGLFRRRK